MRIKPVPPSKVSADQRPLYDAFMNRVGSTYSSFKTMDDSGALLGPWAVWLQVPKTGEAIRQLIETIEVMPGLKKTTVQAVILATGAHFNAAYELYAHSVVGEAAGLSTAQIAALAAGDIPPDLDGEAVLAVRTARRLLHGGALPAPLFAEAIRVLGQDGFDRLIYTVSQYCLVSISLNAYNMPGDYQFSSKD